MPRIHSPTKPSPSPRPRAAAKPLKGKAALLERFKDYPAIEAFSRALNSPEGQGSVPILLRDEDPEACLNTDHQTVLPLGAATCPICKQPARKWHLRIVNTKQPGRVADIRQKAYIPVDLKDLAAPDEVADLFRSEKDTYVRTGEWGERILYKIPLDLYNERKRTERDARDRRRLSKKALRSDLAEASGKTFGDQAGSMVQSDLRIDENIRHKTTLGEELGVGQELEPDV